MVSGFGFTTAEVAGSAQRRDRNVPILIGVSVACVASLGWPVTSQIYAPILLPISLLSVLLAIRSPFLLCLAFVLFSYFRLHEVFPILNPFRLPLLLAGLAVFGFVWRLLARRRSGLHWSPELKYMIALFILVTIGLPFASDWDSSFKVWSESYWKIVCVTLLLSCLMKEPWHFSVLGRALIVVGAAVSSVAISNHVAGIGLIEGTRVTIARELGSPLGDPNELALILLVPFSFAAAMVLRGATWGSQLFGVIGAALSLYAIALTQSRGGFMGAFAVLLTLGVALSRRKSLAVSAALLAGLSLYFAMELSDRAGGGVSDFGEDESATARLYAWQTAVRMALAYPLTGVGIGGFESRYYDFTPVWTYVAYTAHSAWFQSLGEVGLPGACVFVAMVAATFNGAIGAWKKSMSTGGTNPELSLAALSLLASLAGVCVAATFLSSAFTWPFYLLVAAVTSLRGAIVLMPRRADETCRRTFGFKYDGARCGDGADPAPLGG